MSEYNDYGYTDTRPFHTAAYLLDPVLSLAGSLGPAARVLDVGCGNGFFAGLFASKGCEVTGVDLSDSGIAIARKAYPNVRFETLAADEQILAKLGVAPFDLVISTEVVEHLYAPRPYVQGCHAALKPGGRMVLSTPYNGYLKNLALATLGAYDRHHNPLWDGGHVKFWSHATLATLLKESGFGNIQFRGAGRLPWLWKSMVMSGDRMP